MLRQIRFIAPLAIAVLAAPIESASAQSAQFGLMAGASLSKFTGELADDVKNYSSFIAGAFVRLEFMGFAFEPGAYYTRKGAQSEEVEGGTVTNRLQYIQIPIVLKLGMGTGKTRFYVGAGPSIGFNIGCRLSFAGDGTTPDISEDCKDLSGEAGEFDPKSTEFSGIAVAGVDLGKFSLGVRGDFGLTNVYESLQSGSVDQNDVKTRTISAVAMIRF